MSRLDEIEARWQEATPGPWVTGGNRGELRGGTAVFTTHPHESSRYRSHVQCIAEVADGWGDERGRTNAQAIAAAPEDIAWLVAEVRRLQRELEGVQG